MLTLGELMASGGVDPTGRDHAFVWGFATPHMQEMKNIFIAGKRHQRTLADWETISEAGCYSVVLTHYAFPGMVAKISTSSDLAYCDYVERVAIPLQGNPHVPKIYGHVRLKDGSSFTLMEALDESLASLNLPKNFSAHFAQLRTLTVGKSALGTSYVFTPLSDEEVNAQCWSIPEELMCVVRKLRENPNLWAFDMKMENVMLRGDTLVITDPYSID